MANKKIIVPLIAIGVLLVLFVAVMMIGDKAPQTPVNSAATSDGLEYAGYVLTFDTDSVTSITVNTGGEQFTFVKNHSTWAVKDNENISISSASVNSLSGALGGILYTEVITDGSIAPADCGITDAAPFVTFTSELGETTIKKGIDTTDGQLTYVMISGSDDVYLADIESVYRVFKPLSAYRNSAAVNVDFDMVKSITLQSDVSITLEKGTVDMANAVYNEWKITSPLSVSARDDQVKALILDPLEQIQITDFVSDSGDFENYGLGAKDRYVSLTDSSDRTQTVYFSEQIGGRYYISVDDKATIYEISYSAAPYVSMRLIDISDRNIHLVKMNNISEVTVKGDGLDYKIEFADDGGKINGSKVSYDNMNQKAFPAICGLFADDISIEAAGEEAVTMTFKYKDSSSDVISFANYDERYYSVAKNGAPKYLILKHKLTDMAKVLDECKE